eukprot:COSAG06_NODE_18115_length_903_cov_1.303483_2_plen_62_part_01
MQFGFRSNQIDLDLFSFYFGAGWGGLEPPNIHLLAHPFRALYWVFFDQVSDCPRRQTLSESV